MNTASATSTSTAAANEALTRGLVAAFVKGDLATVRNHFADDAVWDLPGRGTLAGTYTGPDAIVGFLARSFELSGGTLSLELYDVLASDQGSCQVQRVTASLPSKTLDCIEVLSHEIRDGKIIRTHHRPDAHAIDEFFG